MTYARDLDEYDTEELQGELDRRAKLVAKNLCTYCQRPVESPACRFHERHSGKPDRPTLQVGDTVYDLSQAFCEGALALHDEIPYTCNPYRSRDDRHAEWDDGHTLASDESVGLTREKVEKALVEAKKRRL